LQALADSDDESLTDGLLTAIDEIEGDFSEKAINIGMYIRNLEASSDAIKEATKIMAARAKSQDNKAEWLRSILINTMQNQQVKRIKSAWFNINVQKNPGRAVVYDESLLPTEYQKEKVIIQEPNKTEIRKALLEGKEVPGCFLDETYSVRIK